ncbi:MAG: TonB-dependent receptor [Acidobacteria bacterium]|nr:TonB-dependent receptor [Acidobacteriota bacterium]
MALALVAGSGVVGYAQDSTTGAIGGTVFGSDSTPIAGAKVILDGGRGQVVRVTDASGAFKASGLIPGLYRITVTAPGFESATKLTATASINTLSPVRVTMSKLATAVVEVLATSQTIDATTQTSGTTFSSETVSSLPLGRSFASVMNLAPGVSTSGIDANNPSVGGSSGLENAYVIDGVNTTGTGFGANGAYSRTYRSLGTGITTDFISETQVKTFGMDAEFGGSTGGRVNAVTKSGDNTFKGSIFSYLDIDALNARDKVPPIIDPTLTIAPQFDGSSRQEFGFTVSGPIIPDKLFYFVGYNPIRNETKRTQIDPSRARYGQQSIAKSQSDTYYAKLNWAINSTQGLEFSLFGDPGKNPKGPQPRPGTAWYTDYQTDPSNWVELEYGGTNASLKYNGVFLTDLLVEAQISQFKSKFKAKIAGSTNSHYQIIDTATNALVFGGPGSMETTEEKNQQINLKITKTFGDFEFKAGYESQNADFNSGFVYQGLPGQVDGHTAQSWTVPGDATPTTNAGANGQAYTTGALVSRLGYVINPALIVPNPSGDGGTTPLSNIGYFYRVSRARYSAPLINTNSPWHAYFIQGKYSWNNRLFIKAGFRWDEQDMKGRTSTYKFKAADATAPRLSITWDPNGDGQNKIYAFYGKYFEKVPMDLAVRSLSTEVGVSRSDWMNISADGSRLLNPIQSGTFLVQANPATGVISDRRATTSSSYVHYTGSAGLPTPVMPGTKLPYTNEYVLGWDSQLREGLTVSNRLIYRSLGRVLEDVSIEGGNDLPYFIANPGENSAGIAAASAAIDPTLKGSGNTATWPKPVRDYWAYEVDASYSTKRLAAFFNLRLSRLEGNYEGLYRNDNGQSDPNITSLYDFSLEYLAMQEHRDTRGLTGKEQYARGPLPNDRAVIMNAGLTYNWDSGFSSSLLAKFQTGTPLSAFYGLQDYDNSGELPAGGRGAEGRTPNTIAFDYSGQYLMKLGGTKSISFRADVFNLFNVHKPVSMDQNLDRSYNVANGNYGNVLTYQQSRRIRLGLKFQF